MPPTRPETLPMAQGQMPAQRGIVIVGWTDPEGTRPWLGALLTANGLAASRGDAHSLLLVPETSGEVLTPRGANGRFAA
jgi:hypothetical protein